MDTKGLVPRVTFRAFPQSPFTFWRVLSLTNQPVGLAAALVYFGVGLECRQREPEMVGMQNAFKSSTG